MLRHLLALVTLLLTLFPAAQAQESSKREQVVERMRTLRAVILTQELELDERTAIKLTARLNDFDAPMMELEKQRHEGMKKAREAARNDELTDKQVDALFQEMTATERALVDLNGERMASTKGLLDPKQRLRFVHIMMRFEREMRKKINEARQGRGHGEPPLGRGGVQHK